MLLHFLQQWLRRNYIVIAALVMVFLGFVVLLQLNPQSLTRPSRIVRIQFADNISSAHLQVIELFNRRYAGRIEVIPVDLPFEKFSTNERKELLTRALRSKSNRLDVFVQVISAWAPPSPLRRARQAPNCGYWECWASMRQPQCNHDFTLGPDGTAAAIRTAVDAGRIPFVLATNTDFSAPDQKLAGLQRLGVEGRIRKYLVVERGGLRFGSSVFSVVKRRPTRSTQLLPPLPIQLRPRAMPWRRYADRESRCGNCTQPWRGSHEL